MGRRDSEKSGKGKQRELAPVTRSTRDRPTRFTPSPQERGADTSNGLYTGDCHAESPMMRRNDMEEDWYNDPAPAYRPPSPSSPAVARLEEDTGAAYLRADESHEDTAGRVRISVRLKRNLSTIQPPSLSKKDVIAPGIDLQSSACPKLNIVIFIVGSRGDVQPYIALALGLIRRHGHRVRLATHGEFSEFVLNANELLRGEMDDEGKPLEGRLEFFDAGGDPRELMAYMVKNPGLIPGVGSIINGDISAKKKMTATFMRGFYDSTFFPDRRNGSFAADAIISNPPAFAHIHVAEALGIPLHMSFTMPWSPTMAFQHPLVTVKDSNAEPGVTNYLSFTMAEVLMWQGLGRLINKFRTSMLGLETLSLKEAPHVLNRMAMPWTYCWSQALIPKPKDWRSSIDIAGFYFLEGGAGFKPDPELLDFMMAGPPPMYIGFGSVPVKDPAAMTRTIFESVRKSGVRALVSAGWGGLGGVQPPKEIFILKGSIPHDWLFADGRVSAVCHHGGAGTTAIGLRNGLPTIVVPFFGDQQFWGDMIRNAGAGPPPIPPKELTSDRLAEAIQFAYSEEAQEAAKRMGETIRAEDGVEAGVASFQRQLPLLHMRCDVDPNRVARWWHHGLYLRLSGGAAVVLHEAGLLDLKDLELHRSKEYDLMNHELDPWTGSIQGVVQVVTSTFHGFAELFYSPARGLFDLTWSFSASPFNILHDLWQGFDNIPGLIGSDTRDKGKVTGWKSGLREAGLGFTYGVWDGLTGLVTEPYVAVKQSGAKGFIPGVGKGLTNVVARPAAGSLGLLAMPFRGVYQSARKSWRRTPEAVFRQPRLDLSYNEARRMTEQEKQNVVARFTELQLETRKRKRKYGKSRHRPFLTGQNLPAPASASTSAPASRSRTPDQAWEDHAGPSRLAGTTEPFGAENGAVGPAREARESRASRASLIRSRVKESEKKEQQEDEKHRFPPALPPKDR